LPWEQEGARNKNNIGKINMAVAPLTLSYGRNAHDKTEEFNKLVERNDDLGVKGEDQLLGDWGDMTLKEAWIKITELSFNIPAHIWDLIMEPIELLLLCFIYIRIIKAFAEFIFPKKDFSNEAKLDYWINRVWILNLFFFLGAAPIYLAVFKYILQILLYTENSFYWGSKEIYTSTY